MALQLVQVVGSLHASQWGSHGSGSHDAVIGSSVYPVLHDSQIWAPSVVQAVPVAAVPWAAQVQLVQAVVDVAMEPLPSYCTQCAYALCSDGNKDNSGRAGQGQICTDISTAMRIAVCVC